MSWDHPQPFTLAVVPQDDDIDGLDHVNNAVYVRWCEQAGWAHSEALGLSLADYRRLDRAMAIRAAHYDYVLPGLAGERLTIGTWLTASDGKLNMTRAFQVRRDGDGATLMRGRWDLVCIDISGGRPRRMPADFIRVYDAAVVSAASSA